MNNEEKMDILSKMIELCQSKLETLENIEEVMVVKTLENIEEVMVVDNMLQIMNEALMYNTDDDWNNVVEFLED